MRARTGRVENLNLHSAAGIYQSAWTITPRLIDSFGSRRHQEERLGRLLEVENPDSRPNSLNTIRCPNSRQPFTFIVYFRRVKRQNDKVQT